MIYFICGLIGAGKTTFAKAHFEHVTDWDGMGSKHAQIYLTSQYYKEGKDAAHITCWPTPDEERFIESLPPEDVRFIWINTSYEQCIENIKKRGRKRDMARKNEILSFNNSLEFRAKNGEYPFEFIDIFNGENSRGKDGD